MNANARKWVEALRSGGFKQGIGRLRSTAADGDRYCCLGVACELYCREVDDGEWLDNDVFILGTEGKQTYTLPLRVQRWLGLRTGDGCFNPTIDDAPATLAELNDSSGCSFLDIADVIEEEPEGLFSDE